MGPDSSQHSNFDLLSTPTRYSFLHINISPRSRSPRQSLKGITKIKYQSLISNVQARPSWARHYHELRGALLVTKGSKSPM